MRTDTENTTTDEMWADVGGIFGNSCALDAVHPNLTNPEIVQSALHSMQEKGCLGEAFPEDVLDFLDEHVMQKVFYDYMLIALETFKDIRRVRPAIVLHREFEDYAWLQLYVTVAKCDPADLHEQYDRFVGRCVDELKPGYTSLLRLSLDTVQTT